VKGNSKPEDLEWNDALETAMKIWMVNQWEIAKRAFTDRSFKPRLLADPVSVLREYGVDVRAGLSVQVVESTANTVYFLLPPGPREFTYRGVDLTDADLKSDPRLKIQVPWDDFDLARKVDVEDVHPVPDRPKNYSGDKIPKHLKDHKR